MDDRPISEEYRDWQNPTLIRLTESAIFPSGGRKRMGLFRCSCGAEFVTLLASIKRGSTRSCGCLRSALLAKRLTKHGDSRRQNHTIEYTVWANMIARCYNPKNNSYARYGGKGVRVCNEWRDSYEVFLSHVGRRPADKTSIDRIDSRKGYEPGNVRWSTALQQSRNRISNIYVEHNGERLCLSEYCQRTGRNINTVRHRLNWYHWPLSKALEVVDGRRK